MYLQHQQDRMVVVQEVRRTAMRDLDADAVFAAIRQGRASVATDEIETFTDSGIALRSGRHLDADLVEDLELDFNVILPKAIEGGAIDAAGVRAALGVEPGLGGAGPAGGVGAHLVD